MIQRILMLVATLATPVSYGFDSAASFGFGTTASYREKAKPDPAQSGSLVMFNASQPTQLESLTPGLLTIAEGSKDRYYRLSVGPSVKIALGHQAFLTFALASFSESQEVNSRQGNINKPAHFKGSRLFLGISKVNPSHSKGGLSYGGFSSILSSKSSPSQVATHRWATGVTIGYEFRGL